MLPGGGEVARSIWLFSTPGLVVHRRAIEAGVRFDECLRMGEDRDFLFRCAAVGRIGVGGDAIVRWTRHDEGGANVMSTTGIARWVHDYVTLCERWYSAEVDGYWREKAWWLANRLVKDWRGDAAAREAWGLLEELSAARGRGLPMKVRVRRMIKRVVG